MPLLNAGTGLCGANNGGGIFFNRTFGKLTKLVLEVRKLIGLRYIAVVGIGCSI